MPTYHQMPNILAAPNQFSTTAILHSHEFSDAGDGTPRALTKANWLDQFGQYPESNKEHRRCLEGRTL
jgi:hypothetical protein